MQVKSRSCGATWTGHRFEAVAINAVSPERSHALTGIRARSDPAADRSSIESRQTGIVFPQRIGLILQPAALDHGQHPPSDPSRDVQDLGVFRRRQLMKLRTTIRARGVDAIQRDGMEMCMKID